MSEASPAIAPPLRPRPTLTELCLVLSYVSATAFGGALPFARRMIVEERRWMSAEEFNEVFSLCQFLPGPNIVNFAVVYGSRIGGPFGALVGLFAILAPAMVVVMVLGALYARYGDMAALQRILSGLAAAAAGLIVAVAAKMAVPLFRRGIGPAPLVAIVIFLAVGVLRTPLLWALLVMTPISIALAWRWRR
ncbi:MAG: chromate transporter [Variibacter sp.]